MFRAQFASIPDARLSITSGCPLSLHAGAMLLPPPPPLSLSFHLLLPHPPTPSSATAIVRVEAQKSKNALIMRCAREPCACAAAAQHATWCDLGWVTSEPLEEEEVGLQCSVNVYARVHARCVYMHACMHVCVCEESARPCFCFFFLHSLFLSPSA